MVFLEALRQHVERLVLVGRLDPQPGTLSLSAAPRHRSCSACPTTRAWRTRSPVARSLLVSVVRFWRLLDDVDAVWVLGPYPHSVLLAVLTALRRKRLVLGVRQDMPLYVRSRRPDRRWMHFGADVLEGIWIESASSCGLALEVVLNVWSPI